MDVHFKGRPEGFTSLFEPLATRPIYGSREILPKRNTSVNNIVDTLIEQLGDPNTRVDALRRFKELPIRYFLAASPDKAALAAERVYKRKLLTPAEMFETLVLKIVDNYDKIQKIETRMGLGKPDRLTLGGCIEPGIKLEILREKDSLAASTVKDCLIGATRGGEPNLAVLFPQFAPENSDKKDDKRG